MRRLSERVNLLGNYNNMTHLLMIETLDKMHFILHVLYLDPSSANFPVR